MLSFALRRPTCPGSQGLGRLWLNALNGRPSAFSTHDSGYERKTPHEHVLLRPGMYVGQMESSVTDTWVYDAASKQMQKRSVHYSPALLKIFDEILVNAADNVNRGGGGDKGKATTSSTSSAAVDGNGRMSRIDIEISASLGTGGGADTSGKTKASRGLKVRITNDGQTVPVHIHRKENIHIPELIFGHLLTGSNFEETASAAAAGSGSSASASGTASMTGGRHGYGAKLTNIFSNRFTVDIYNSTLLQRYTQQWSSNMHTCEPPELTTGEANTGIPASSGNYTSIAFEPDLRRFNLHKPPPSPSDGSTSLTNLADPLLGTLAMMHRRAFDVAGCISNKQRTITITVNGQQLPIGNFQAYMDLFCATSITPTSMKLPLQVGHEVGNAVALSGNGAAPLVVASKSTSVEQTPANKTTYYCKVSDRWEVGVAVSPSGTFEQLSFVNGVWTPRGGTHVNAVASQVVGALEEAVSKSRASAGSPMPSVHMLRSKIFLFVRASIESPTFDSQAKDTLTSPARTWGSVPLLPPTFLKTLISQSGIVDDIISDMAMREHARLLRSTREAAGSASGRGARTVDVPKLEDAHGAGGSRSGECSLILTEGDSAKALAVAGLEVVGRDKYGVLPLRGKILNVRGASARVMQASKELSNLVKALGLQYGRVYTASDFSSEKDISALSASSAAIGVHGQGMRYGRVLIMTDQDHDGAHIKGLLINFFSYFWPSLLDVPGFLQHFITPLVKVKPTKRAVAAAPGKAQGKDGTVSFFSMPEHDEWMQLQAGANPEDATVGAIKYYKGLGTNTAAEGREYFKNLDVHRKLFFNSGLSGLAGNGATGVSSALAVNSDPRLQTAEIVDLAFNKKKAKHRKHWLETHHKPNAFIDPHKPTLSVGEFIDTELMQFSFADNVRSLPSVVDGLKPAQRKVLYGCFKKRLTAPQEMKVVQLAGYIAENTAYHHGDISLHTTIIHMAQDYVGSNNLPLLLPSGQFGTRAKGGIDSASPRYIFTALSPMSRYLFPEADDVLLTHLTEDGQEVEPEHFLPILPTLLINGTYGIGTGWSTFVPPHDPMRVADYVKRLVRGESVDRTQLVYPPKGHVDGDILPSGLLKPWIKGSHGAIDRVPDGRGVTYRSYGHVNRLDRTTLEVRELPYGMWTDDYKKFLIRLCEKGDIKDFSENHTHTSVHFTISGSAGQMDALCGTEELESSAAPPKARKGRKAKKIFDLSSADLQGELQHNHHENPFLYKKMRLHKPMSMRNMHAFDSNGRIKHYYTSEEICEEHFDIRYKGYTARRASLERQYNAEVAISSNKSRFVKALLSGNLEVMVGPGRQAASQAELVQDLVTRGYATADALRRISDPITTAIGSGSGSGVSSFSYLLDMPIASLTEERVVALDKAASEAAVRLEKLVKSSEQDLWMRDLDAFTTAYAKGK